ncbi:MAG: tRNA (adenosine(37)-N6)-threonylcarbamoyltransferase complex ATPase subunit type 1 TsaE [Arenimonas sp.]
MKIVLADAEATENLGQLLAQARPSLGVLYLFGEIGAGKSTLARALLRELGVSGPIKSPTYTLIERYHLAKGEEAAHLDLYRIAAAGELDFLGLDEVAENTVLWLVEWPERGQGALPKADLLLNLEPHGDGRIASLRSETETGAAWLARTSKMAGFRASS